MPELTPPFMPEDQLLALIARLSNEGRWGADDEIGTLNFISPRKRVEAAGLVREGRVVSIGKDLVSSPAGAGVSPVIHRMLFAGDSLQADIELVDRQAIPISTLDVVEIAPHGETVTHVDA